VTVSAGENAESSAAPNAPDDIPGGALTAAASARSHVFVAVCGAITAVAAQLNWASSYRPSYGGEPVADMLMMRIGIALVGGPIGFLALRRLLRTMALGLSSGSWARVLVDYERVKKLTIVEINHGYVEAIKRYPVNAPVLTDKRTKVVFDDGRRWLVRNPDAKFDFILMNTQVSRCTGDDVSIWRSLHTQGMSDKKAPSWIDERTLERGDMRVVEGFAKLRADRVYDESGTCADCEKERDDSGDPEALCEEHLGQALGMNSNWP